MTRIFTPQALVVDNTITLEKAPSVHLTKVLRMQVGESLRLFNGDGFNYCADIVQTGKSVVLPVCDKTESTNESPLHITLVQGISRSERMDYTVQKSVELGVTGIQPLITQKSSVKLDDTQRRDKKMQHWQAVVISACEQSGRSIIPPVAMPLTLPQWLAQARGTQDCVLLDPTAPNSLINHPISGQCTLIIGPESGFSPHEIQLMLEADVQRAALGPRVLRTETAAVAAIAVMQSRWGDFC